MSTEVVIANAARTPIGAFGGALSPLAPAELPATTIRPGSTLSAAASEKK